MFYVSTCLLFDRDDKLLIYLRDDKPSISFPNHWDLFGGIIEDGETPEEALLREVKEEVGIDLTNYYSFKEYKSNTVEEPNIKHVFYAKVEYLPNDLTLLDVGQKITSIDLEECNKYKFANILGDIINDFAEYKSVNTTEIAHNLRVRK